MRGTGWVPTFMPVGDREWFVVDSTGTLARDRDGKLARYWTREDALKDAHAREDKKP